MKSACAILAVVLVSCLFGVAGCNKKETPSPVVVAKDKPSPPKVEPDPPKPEPESGPKGVGKIEPKPEPKPEIQPENKTKPEEKLDAKAGQVPSPEALWSLVEEGKELPEHYGKVVRFKARPRFGSRICAFNSDGSRAFLGSGITARQAYTLEKGRMFFLAVEDVSRLVEDVSPKGKCLSGYGILREGDLGAPVMEGYTIVLNQRELLVVVPKSTPTGQEAQNSAGSKHEPPKADANTDVLIGEWRLARVRLAIFTAPVPADGVATFLTFHAGGQMESKEVDSKGKVVKHESGKYSAGADGCIRMGVWVPGTSRFKVTKDELHITEDSASLSFVFQRMGKVGAAAADRALKEEEKK